MGSRVINLEEDEDERAPVFDIHFHPNDKNLFAAAFVSGVLTIYTREEREVMALVGPSDNEAAGEGAKKRRIVQSEFRPKASIHATEAIRRCRFNGANWIAYGTSAGNVAVHDINGKLVAKFPNAHDAGITAMTWWDSAEGYLLTGDEDGGIKIWDISAAMAGDKGDKNKGKVGNGKATKGGNGKATKGGNGKAANGGDPEPSFVAPRLGLRGNIEACEDAIWDLDTNDEHIFAASGSFLGVFEFSKIHKTLPTARRPEPDRDCCLLAMSDDCEIDLKTVDVIEGFGDGVTLCALNRNGAGIAEFANESYGFYNRICSGLVEDQLPLNCTAKYRGNLLGGTGCGILNLYDVPGMKCRGIIARFKLQEEDEGVLGGGREARSAAALGERGAYAASIDILAVSADGTCAVVGDNSESRVMVIDGLDETVFRKMPELAHGQRAPIISLPSEQSAVPDQEAATAAVSDQANVAPPAAPAPAPAPTPAPTPAPDSTVQPPLGATENFFEDL